MSLIKYFLERNDYPTIKMFIRNSILDPNDIGQYIASNIKNYSTFGSVLKELYHECIKQLDTSHKMSILVTMLTKHNKYSWDFIRYLWKDIEADNVDLLTDLDIYQMLALPFDCFDRYVKANNIDMAILTEDCLMPIIVKEAGNRHIDPNIIIPMLNIFLTDFELSSYDTKSLIDIYFLISHGHLTVQNSYADYYIVSAISQDLLDKLKSEIIDRPDAHDVIKHHILNGDCDGSLAFYIDYCPHMGLLTESESIALLLILWCRFKYTENYLFVSKDNVTLDLTDIINPNISEYFPIFGWYFSRGILSDMFQTEHLPVCPKHIVDIIQESELHGHTPSLESMEDIWNHLKSDVKLNEWIKQNIT